MTPPPSIPTALESTSSPELASFYVMHLMHESPVAVAALNPEGQLLVANPAFHTLMEPTSRTAASGVALTEFLHADSREELQRQLRALTEEKTPPVKACPVELLVVTTTQGAEHRRTASVYLSRVASPGSESCCLIAHLVDTTEQKNLELRFAHSQKMQAVGQLAGGVAHDFNNLLTAMIGFCDLLLMRHPAGDPSFADIMQIKQNANRAANLVRQLLAFSRRQTLQPKVLDITDVLSELSHLIRRLIGENIELKMVHGRDLGAIKVDQGQLEQVIINLAVNARDAMSGSGGTLTIRTSDVTIDAHNHPERTMISPSPEDRITSGQYIIVDVLDTGVGIPRELIQQIFEPFFSTKEVGSGTGLGLSTVYGIVKQTGGYVYVASTPGQGTQFSIYFPRHAVDVQTAKLESGERPASDLTGSGTILLVEDETPVRSFAARALANKGYRVLEADSGETALEIFAREGRNIHLIISDVIMPGMTGPDMVTRILKDAPNMPVIFISGYAEDAFVDSFGADVEFNFLPKPFTLKQLAAKVKEVLTPGFSADASGGSNPRQLAE